MKIVCLVENTSRNDSFKFKHGLSFYIETDNHKILFDLGSNNLFLVNAKKLGVDISQVDVLIISHGHVDHGGALRLFLEHNQIAKIYIRRSAFDKHTTKFLFANINIGLDEKLKNNQRMIFTDDIHKIDNSLLLFVSQKKTFKLPSNNATLFMKDLSGSYLEDDFFHEQSLIISENNKAVLLGGCAHSGIINILNDAEIVIDKHVDLAISGFHLFNPVSKKLESKEYIELLKKELIKLNTNFYTCHCTGKKAFNYLKISLGSRLKYIAVGDEISI